MEKAESLSFLTVPGSGGPGQSLHNDILVGAKRLNCHWKNALAVFFHKLTVLYPIFGLHKNKGD
jgi:hypothetical protein